MLFRSQEEVQTVLMGAEYVTKEYITQKLLTVLGDADMAEGMLKEMEAEEVDRFDGADLLPEEDK